MASEKKDQGAFVVVRHRPWRRVRNFLILLTFSVVSCVVGYMIGMAQGGFYFSDMAKTRTMLSGELTGLRKMEQESRKKVINLDRGRQMDQQALTRSRDTIAKLEAKIAALRADLTFYKNIMSPTKSHNGLQVDRLELESLGSDRHVAFELALTQVGDNSSYIGGSVVVNVVGEQDGKRKKIPLQEVSDDIKADHIRFHYRYFQDIKGVMTLPEGFDPIAVQAIAKATGKKASRVERTFKWQL